MKIQNIKNLQILLFLLSLIFLLLAANFYIYQNPKFSKQAQIRYYEKMAGQFAPSSLQAKRYRAIAEALKQGATTYSFEAGRLPALGGQ